MQVKSAVCAGADVTAMRRWAVAEPTMCNHLQPTSTCTLRQVAFRLRDDAFPGSYRYLDSAIDPFSPGYLPPLPFPRSLFSAVHCVWTQKFRMACAVCSGSRAFIPMAAARRGRPKVASILRCVSLLLLFNSASAAGRCFYPNTDEAVDDFPCDPAVEEGQAQCASPTSHARDQSRT
jgi:hypothetical protein